MGLYANDGLFHIRFNSKPWKKVYFDLDRVCKNAHNTLENVWALHSNIDKIFNLLGARYISVDHRIVAIIFTQKSGNHFQKYFTIL